MLRFEPAEFIRRLGRRLVSEFAEADQAGSPGLVGSAREHPARTQLEKMMPPSVAIGSGLLIDSYGGVSRQQDIVMFERDYCPTFSINETPEATYYPIETTIAVGEVKSSLDTASLTDAFEKIVSAKKLRRFALATNDFYETAVSYRKYTSSTSFAASVENQFDQHEKDADQIYGFILCGQFALKPESMVQLACRLWKQYPQSVCPNVIISLSDGFVQPYSSSQKQLALSMIGAEGIAMCNEPEKAFPHLVRRLNAIVRMGRTVDLTSLSRYFDPGGDVKETYKISHVSPLTFTSNLIDTTGNKDDS